VHAAAVSAAASAPLHPSLAPVPRRLPGLGGPVEPLDRRGGAGRARGYRAQTRSNCHLGANHLMLLLSLFFVLCKTGNVAAAAEPRFLSLLAAGLRGAGARLAAGFGLSWDPKVSSFSLSRASNYLLGHLPLSVSDTRRLSTRSRSCFWHSVTESPRVGLG